MSSPLPERSLDPGDAAGFARAVTGPARPVVLRGWVAGWPLVQAARQGDAELAALLCRHDSGREVDAVLLRPEAAGRLGYDATMAGFNFLRNRLPLSRVIEQIQRYAAFDVAPAVAVQSAPLADCLPGLDAAHRLPLLHPSIGPRIWIGNAIVTPTHFDESANIACVVAGRRRFTLFAPELADRLYIGPLEHAPTGTPISLASPLAPDAARFPRLAEALDQAFTAELGPGDALYIPPLWWHHVESLARLNVLVNFWWRGDPAAPGQGAAADSALEALWLAALSLRQRPASERAAWSALFQHLVFGPAEAVEQHIPADRRGLLGPLDEASRRALRQAIGRRLTGGDPPT